MEVAKSLEKSFIGTTLEELKVAVEQYSAIDAWCSNPAMSEESFNTLVNIINNYKPLGFTPEYSKLIDNTIAHKLTV